VEKNPAAAGMGIEAEFFCTGISQPTMTFALGLLITISPKN
jgi:hypothetical protein